MIKIVTLTLLTTFASFAASAQVVLNEIYTSPGGGKNEFFELYNSGTESTPLSVDGFSIVTYFEQGSSKGFYVLDLPSLTINPRGFLVGSSGIPFNYQGTTNSISSNFSWNIATLPVTSGYMKKWVMTGSDASDGNLSYNEASVPANFNDFFYDKSSGGANYSIFVFKNGVLINSFYGGSGGSTTQPSFITSMPDLNVNSVIAGSSTPFTIQFSTFTANLAEFVTPAAGTDNGYTRAKDGVCNTWDKSSSSSNHTPGITNGASAGGTGTVTVTGSITRAILPATLSTVTFDITAGASTAFPVELQVYTDNGTVAGDLDALDTYITSVTQTSLADPYATISFAPASANIIVVAKTAAGCFGQVKLINVVNSTLPVKLVSFNGNQKNEHVQLNWTVDLNETAEQFVVEKSIANGKFNAIGTVKALSAAGRQYYSFNDPNAVDNKVSYRLLMTDRDQKSEYSKVLFFNSNSSGASFSLLQNPVQQKLDISIVSKEREAVTLRVVDMRGAILFTQKMNVNAGSNVLNVQLPANVTRGTYVMSVGYSKGTFNQKFIKQ